MRTIDDIPAELMKHAFAHLPFYDLLRAAGVSQRWRDLGIEHPMFWKFIGVTSAAAGTLEVLEMRLGQGRGRPFFLTIEISGMHPLIITRLLRRLLPATMYCVQKLHITLDANYILDLWPVLNMRAPELVDFHLYLLSPDRLLPRITIMPWIFSSEPAKLKCVSLVDVILPDEPVAAFAQVVDLKLDYPASAVLTFPNQHVESCPALNVLFLGAGTVSFDAPFSQQLLDIVSHLTILDVNLTPPGTTSFVTQMPRLSRIPVVILTGVVDFDAMYDFLEPLRSLFNFAVLRVDPARLQVMIQDRGTGLVRIVNEEISSYRQCDPEGNDMANVLFDNEEFAPQVHTITISVTLWGVMSPYLRHYRTIATLIVEFDWLVNYPPDTQPLPEEPVVWTGAKCLVLQSRVDFVYVDAQDVLAFVDRNMPNCAHLQLRGVLVAGGTEVLSGRLTSVSSFTTLLWPGGDITRRPDDVSTNAKKLEKVDIPRNSTIAPIEGGDDV